MTCTPITPSQFKQLKPSFQCVSDDVVQQYIELAQLWASDWPDKICETVQVAVTCHLLTLDGLGSSGESRLFASGRGDLQSIRTGNVTLTRFRSAAEGAGKSTIDWFGQTTCGRAFMVYVRMYKGGPRVGMGASCGDVSPYAKDIGRLWWGF